MLPHRRRGLLEPDQPILDALWAPRCESEGTLGAADDEQLAAQYDIEQRICSGRVMHEKFGVVGDDVFNGSSNWSKSSITKHAEDRFLFRNMPKLAQKFVEEFERLWRRGQPPG